MAAVALPQYTKAIEKSRTAEAMQVLGDLATAEQLYYMAQNEFVTSASATDLAKLDLTFQSSTTCKVGETAKNPAIETSSYCIQLASAGTDSKSVKATATRKSGGTGYAGETLTIQVDPDGTITRGGTLAGDGKLASTWKN